MIVIKVAIYLLLCLGVGYLARDTRLGFWGTTLVSIFVTPLLVFIALLVLGQPSRARDIEGKP